MMDLHLPAVLALLREGFSSPNLADLILRVALGTFFTISGANKLFHKGRHQSLCNTLTRLGIPCVSFMQWWVPGWTFAGGILLTLGLFTTFAAGVLLIIMLVAIWCEAHVKVQAYRPINGPDRCADYLYLPEVLYTVMLVTVMVGGTGAYSLDRLLWGAL